MDMKNKIVSIMGAGFNCVDIIQYGKNIQSALGGTAANVTSILSCFNQNSTFLYTDYKGKWGEWLKHEFTNRNVNLLTISTSNKPAPRVIESLDIRTGKHSFFSTCPVCGRKISYCSLPQKGNIKEKIISQAKQTNVFYYDRSSSGIKHIVDNHFCGWNYYEPNTCRNYQSFINTAKASDILKFSIGRIYDSYMNRILKDLQESRVCIVISTMGQNGFYFAYRKTSGILSDWIRIDPVKVDYVVDDTGAGDWFTAVFLLLFLRCYPEYIETINPELLYEILDVSRTVAAIKCAFLGVHGIFEDQKTKKYLEELLDIRIQSYKEAPLEWGNGCHLCGWE